jgi:hypothetical protein
MSHNLSIPHSTRVEMRRLPSQQNEVVTYEVIVTQGLGQDVCCWLVLGVDGMPHGYLASSYEVTEMMIFQIHVCFV